MRRLRMRQSGIVRGWSGDEFGDVAAGCFRVRQS
jgi:hypothetical protein